MTKENTSSILTKVLVLPATSNHQSQIPNGTWLLDHAVSLLR